MDNVKDKIKEFGLAYDMLTTLIQATDDIEILIELLNGHIEVLQKIGQLAYDLAYDCDKNVDIRTFTTSLLGIAYIWNKEELTTLLGGDFVMMQDMFKEGKFNK